MKSDRSATVTRRVYAGKACGFDLKQIQSIAGNVPAEEVAPVEEPVVEPVEEVKNVDPLLAARQAWLQHFEETYGRKPSAEEFTAAKSQNFEFFVGSVPEAEFANPDSTEETQEYVPQQPTQEYTAPLAAEQTQIFAGPNVTEAGPAQKKQKAPKTKGWKETFQEENWDYFCYRSPCDRFGGSLLLLPVYNTCRSDSR